MLKRSTCLLLIVQLASIAFATQDTVNPDLVNVKVVRNVDLSTHLPKIVSEITLENGGKSAIRSFLFTPDPVLASDLSFIGASVSLLENACLHTGGHSAKNKRNFPSHKHKCKTVRT